MYDCQELVWNHRESVHNGRKPVYSRQYNWFVNFKNLVTVDSIVPVCCYCCCRVYCLLLSGLNLCDFFYRSPELLKLVDKDDVKNPYFDEELPCCQT